MVCKFKFGSHGNIKNKLGLSSSKLSTGKASYTH